MHYDVYGIGNVLVDILVKVDDEVVSGLSLKKGGLNLVNEKEAKVVLDHLKGVEQKICSGGACANTLAGFSMFGGKAMFCGKAGEDDLADHFIADLLKEGVASRVVQKKGQTGVCITLITPDTERTFVVNLGAATELSKQDIVLTDIKKSRFFHISGYELDIPGVRAAVLELLPLIKKAGVQVSFDIGDPFIAEKDREFYQQFIEEFVDILFVNKDEAIGLVGTDPDKTVHELFLKPSYSFVKYGSKGSHIYTNSIRHHVPAYSVDAIDTTGAGDIYAAGVLFGLVNHMPIKNAVEFGSFVASKVVQKIGARMSPEYYSDVHEFIKEYKNTI